MFKDKEQDKKKCRVITKQVNCDGYWDTQKPIPSKAQSFSIFVQHKLSLKIQ